MVDLASWYANSRRVMGWPASLDACFLNMFIQLIELIEVIELIVAHLKDSLNLCDRSSVQNLFLSCFLGW